MIVDLERFIAQERPFWKRLEQSLRLIERRNRNDWTLNDLKEFHYLYERASSGLARISTFSAEKDLRLYLEQLVARAYAEIHETRGKSTRFSFVQFFTKTVPQTFRRRFAAFSLSAGVMFIGAVFGAVLLLIDPQAKEVIMPFSHLTGDPSDRVAQEEAMGRDSPQTGYQSSFAATLMQNNIRVSILAMALGMTFGVGTLIVLFYNGIILGAVALDYIAAGESTFLLAWLLPHGAIGWGDRDSLQRRMRRVGNDLLTLMAAVALMLVWAGIVESFFSQYHEPIIPYSVKITFGLVELAALVFYLARVGIEPTDVSKTGNDSEANAGA
jgi:uncharacterized membrane protein SpoIIM required for sporulation